MTSRDRKQIGTWLLAGVFMIVIQTMLGGITRLTESGLSITEWNVVSGTLPPLNANEWNVEFEKYKQSSQYHLLNEGMQLNDFKKIFWWEYIHRLWARMFLPVFLIPLIYFIATKKINASTVIKSLIALVLGALQGLVGWIMVASGLKDRAWVAPVELTMHFILAMILVSYMMWIALQTFGMKKENVVVVKLKPLVILTISFLFVQLCYGSLMAGNHAALFYPTFPKFNDKWIPEELFVLKPGIANLFENTGMIQLIHRVLGLLIGLLVIIFYMRAKRIEGSIVFNGAARLEVALVIIQILLGIFTLINSLGGIPVFFGVAHQLIAVLFLLNSVVLLHQIMTAKNYSSEKVNQEQKVVSA